MILFPHPLSQIVLWLIPVYTLNITIHIKVVEPKLRTLPASPVTTTSIAYAGRKTGHKSNNNMAFLVTICDRKAHCPDLEKAVMKNVEEIDLR